MPPISRDISCGLYGHSFDEYLAENDIEMQNLQDYQLMLYKLVDEQIHTGMRRFFSPLVPGAALWMAEYVLCQKRAMDTAGIELHILTDKIPSGIKGQLIEEVLNGASSIHIIPVKHKMDYFRELMNHCSKIITVENCGVNDIIRAYAQSKGVTVIQRGMPINGEVCWRSPCWG